jgi:RNA polymerase sigma-70 factor (ECF subfamily)
MRRFFLQGGKQESGDEELLARYRRSGEQELLAQLYSRYVELVYGVCMKYLQEPAAEDATMAIYEELVTKTREHEIDNFRSWLYVLAKNHCLMQLRREKRNITVNYEPGIMHSLDSRHHTMEMEDDNEEEARLKDCLEQLNAQQKQCIELFYYRDHSYKEISEMLKEQLGKVRSHIQNGRRNLRICMEEKEKKLKG